MGMRSSPDGASWGHDFINDPSLAVERGRWICVELMMKMNQPVTANNGEQSLWIDGRPWVKQGQTVSHLGLGFPRGKWVWDSFLPDPSGEPFEGFRWRETDKLNLNFLWVLLYMTKAPAGHVSKVWFDDLVVACDYIGPISPISGRSPDGTGTAVGGSGLCSRENPPMRCVEAASFRTSRVAAGPTRTSVQHMLPRSPPP
jgi:hypothetical protein